MAGSEQHHTCTKDTRGSARCTLDENLNPRLKKETPSSIRRPMAVKVTELPDTNDLLARGEDCHRLLPGVQEPAQDAILGVQRDPLDPMPLHHGMINASHHHRVGVTAPLDDGKMLLITPLLGALSLKENHRLVTTDQLPHAGVENLNYVTADITFPDLASLSHINRLRKANRVI